MIMGRAANIRVGACHASNSAESWGSGEFDPGQISGGDIEDGAARRLPLRTFQSPRVNHPGALYHLIPSLMGVTADEVVIHLRLDELLILVVTVPVSQRDMGSIECYLMEPLESPQPKHRFSDRLKSRIAVHIAPSDIEIKRVEEPEDTRAGYITGVQHDRDILSPKPGQRSLDISSIVVGIGNESNLHANDVPAVLLRNAKIENLGIDLVHSGYQDILINPPDFHDKGAVFALLIAIEGPERDDISTDLGDGSSNPA